MNRLTPIVKDAPGAPELIVCAGPDGYRLAFSGPDYFEALGEFPTWEAARDALKAARISIQPEKEAA